MPSADQKWVGISFQQEAGASQTTLALRSRNCQDDEKMRAWKDKTGEEVR